MKISNFFFLLTIIILSSCSSSNEDNQENTIPTDEFEFSVNGIPIEVSKKPIKKESHNIHLGTDNTNTPFLISFDENGHFGKIVYDYREPISNVVKKFTSSRNYSSNYFNFQLLSYDAVNKRVKASFYGNIYRDPSDLNSEAKFVSGSFDLPYEEYVPPIANIINQATINGVYWRATNKYQSRNIASDYHNMALHSLSDDEYKIMIFFNDDTTLPGTYNFSNSDIIKKVQIAKYNVLTSSYTFYNCTGVITLTNLWDYCIQGTYSFNGVNPTDSSDIITVENGSFKLDYDPNN